jgi:hypothetical protein
MGLPPYHLRLIGSVRPVCERYGLLLAGGYALRAHGFTDRPNSDLNFVTSGETPLPEVTAHFVAALRRAGLAVDMRETGERMSRLVVAGEPDRQVCEIDLTREVLQDRPEPFDLCPVVGLDDAVGLKVRALHDRGLPRDFIDVAAVSDVYGFRRLEQLGAVHHDDEWRLEDLLQRLEAVDVLPEESFAAYGLDENRVHAVRRFAYAWAEDIKLRRVEDGDIDYDVADLPEPD